MFSFDTLVLIIQITLLVLISGTCSGLNIALMALDLSDIRRKAKTGNRKAIQVLPLRKNYHLTLAAILFTNVGAVSASSLVLEEALNGILAGIITTLLWLFLARLCRRRFFRSKHCV